MVFNDRYSFFLLVPTCVPTKFINCGEEAPVSLTQEEKDSTETLEEEKTKDVTKLNRGNLFEGDIKGTKQQQQRRTE